MPTDRDIALVRAGLEAAIEWLGHRDGMEALRMKSALDPAAIAATVPAPQRPADPTEAEKYDAFEWLRATALYDKPPYSCLGMTLMQELAALRQLAKEIGNEPR